MGIRNGDYSVAQVLDSHKRQVATRRGLAHPDHMADILEALGKYYNYAYIVVENNGHGIHLHTPGERCYSNFYMETVVDKITDKETVKLGFTTTSKTKPLIIDQLRAANRDGELEINDKQTLREMLTYVVNDNGAMEAEHGCHDDTVMALALANHVHEVRGSR